MAVPIILWMTPFELISPLSFQRGRLGDKRQGASTPYKNIGTNNICDLSWQEDGRFLSLHITSSSLYPDDKKPGARPAFGTYLLEGMAYLKDGQTAEIATATDGLTGEVIKAEVTVRTIK